MDTMYSDSSMHLYPNGSVLETGDWVHHNIVATTGISVGDKYEVRIVASPPAATTGRAGEFGIANDTQGMSLRPSLYKFTVSVRCGISPL